MLDIPVEAGEPYAGQTVGLDPNTEHPPLGKAIIAGSMAAFGDNPYGWRVPAVVFGTATIGLVALTVVGLGGGSSAAALMAAFFLAFDNLAFVHSRIATLDIFVVTFSLVAAWCYSRRWPVPAGLALALAGLVKINGLWLGAGFLIFEAWQVGRRVEPWRPSALRLGLTGITTIVAFLAGLWVLDRLFTTYATPIEHVQRIFSYGMNLKASGTGTGSQPWE